MEGSRTGCPAFLSKFIVIVSVVEGRIFSVDGFQVQIMASDKDVRSDKQLPKQYEADRALKNTATVRSWKQLRFYKQFPGYDANVLYADGSIARGNTTLGRVRDSYMDDAI